MSTLISLAILAILVLFISINHWRRALLPVLIVGMLITLALTVLQWNKCIISGSDMLIFDNYAIAFSSLMIFLTFVVFLMSSHYYNKGTKNLEEIYAILIFTLAGAVMMTSFGNLAMLFIGIETLSISLYVLAGSKKTDPKSNEAAMKYFLMGSFASGFLVFGIALIYGASGSFNLDSIAEYVNSEKGNLPSLFKAGVLLLTVGLAFKVAAAPFHFWAPDVYDGSPTIITAFMATVVKIAGFAAFYRIFSYHLLGDENGWSATIWGMAAATMLLGNLTGLYQVRFKRMLAYSSISHTGYMLLAIVSINSSSAGALLLYSASYGIATLLAFGILVIMGNQTKDDSIENFNGLAKTNPLLTAGLMVSLLSLTGIPPLAGFMAKYHLFASAIESGHLWLVVIALIGSAISVVYYFRPLTAAFLKEGNGQIFITPMLCKIMMLICILFLLLLGFFPGILFHLPLNAL